MLDGSHPCPACGYANPSENRFCGGCGSRLPVMCPACQEANPPANRFCAGCGEPLGSGAAASETARKIWDKERRLVTIVFSDVVDSTTIGEMLDPEQVDELIEGAQTAMAEVAARYGGNVAKYLGDGMMLLFGAPIAHEDDPERAVLAALEMQHAVQEVSERLGPEMPRLQIRIGITSGEVVAGEIAGTYDVIGDTANTAARLQSAADMGGVLVDEETMRLAGRMIRFGERRELRLKGKHDTVAAYPALEVLDEMVERWEGSQRRTPLVGRQDELSKLLEAWHAADRGSGRFVSVTGEGGIGKSRLIAEAVSRIRTESSPTILRARALSYGQRVSLSAVADLVRNLCDIHESDRPERAHTLLIDRVTTLLSTRDPEVRDEAIDVLAGVLGLAPTRSVVTAARPPERRRVLVRTLRLLLGVLASESPCVFILEDLHWCDTASAEILAQVLADVPTLRLLVLTSHRPDWSPPWKDLDWIERIDLSPLDSDESRRMGGAVLNARMLSEDLSTYLYDRSSGNPYFIEETLRALRETDGLTQRDGLVELRPGASDSIPEQLVEMLEARLDRLEPSARHIGQVASVLGRSFALPILCRIAGENEDTVQQRLAVLQRAEVALPRPGGRREYMFKSNLVREALYESMMHRHREALHEAAAEALMALGDSEEHVELIAFHYTRTRQHTKASEWLERAGDHAASLYAHDEALGHYEQARAHLEQEDSPSTGTRLARIAEKTGAVLAAAGRYDDALQALGEAVTAYREGGQLDELARAIARIGEAHAERGSSSEGLEVIEGAMSDLSQVAPSSGLVSLHVALARLHFSTGMYEQQFESAQRASNLAREVGDEKLLAEAEIWRGAALSELGQHDEALAVMTSAIPVAESSGDLDALEHALGYVAVIQRFSGQLEESYASWERVLELAKETGDPSAAEFAMANLAEVALYLGRWQEAEVHCRQALEIVRAAGTSWSSPYPLLRLGQILLQRGNQEEAIRLLAESTGVAECHGDLHALRSAQSLLADLDLDLGRPDSALERLRPLLDRDGLEEADVTHLLSVLARARAEAGDLDGAGQAAAEAVQRCSHQQDSFDLIDALRARGRVFALSGRWDEAETDLQEAVDRARLMHYPYGEASARLDLGLTLLERGEASGRAQVEQAQAIFRELQAQSALERCERILGGRGIDPTAFK